MHAWKVVPLLAAATVILGGLAAPPSVAEEAPKTVRLADLIEEARNANPEIRAARERSTAARFAPSRVAAYEDPMFTYEAFNTPESLNLRRTDNNILKLSQKIPFPGKLGLAGTAAQRDADMAAEDLRMAELEVVSAVKRAYYDLWKAGEDAGIYARDEDLVARFAKIAEQKYAVGMVSQPDVLRAQVELTRLVSRVTTAALAVDGARAELNALLSRPADEALGVVEPPPGSRLDATPEGLTETALRRRPEVASQQAAIARDETNVRLARLGYLPDFDVTLERFFNSGREDGFGAIVSISLPFAYKSKYDAAASEAKARLAGTEADSRRIEDRVRKEVRQAYLRARTAQLERDLYRTTHVPQAEQALQASEISYQTGKIDFLSLIDSLRAIEAVHVEHVEAEAEFEKAFADLERAVGEPIERGEAR